jgi:O-antigen ligase
MDLIGFLLQGSVILCFLLFFLKACTKGLILEGIVIASFYSTISSILGQENFKAVITIILYLIVFFSRMHFRRKNRATFFEGEAFNFSVLLLFIYLIIRSIISPAFGYEYLEVKVIFTFFDIFVPLFLFMVVKPQMIRISFLLSFFEISSILVAGLMMFLAANIGIDNILNAEFMVRVASGESNVIWLGRFLSIGFIVVLFKKRMIFLKISLCIFILVALILTGSKSVLLFTFLGIMIHLFYIDRGMSGRIKIKVFSVSLLLLFSLGFFISLLNPLAVERRFSTKSGTIGDREGRIEKVYEHFLKEENILFGNGFATSGFPNEHTYNKRSYPHNITIEVLYELGIFGLGLYYLCLLLPLYIYKINRGTDSQLGLLMSIHIVFILYSQTSGDFFSNAVPFVFSGYIMHYFKSSYKTGLDEFAENIIPHRRKIRLL